MRHLIYESIRSNMNASYSTHKRVKLDEELMLHADDEVM